MVDAGRSDDPRKLEAASTQWLRHTCGSHAVEQGVPLNVVQQNFGHASLNMTTLYTTQGNVLSAGDYLYTEAGEIHALVALEDSVIFASTERAIRVIETQAAA